MSIPSKRDDVRIIQTWHSMGAIKKFGYQCLDTPAGRTSEDARVGRMHKNYDLILSAGPGAIPAYSQAFGYDAEVFRATGLPHIDYLLDADPQAARLQAQERIVRDNSWLVQGKRIVLYAPTFRQRAGSGNWIADALRGLAAACDESTLLVFSGHPYDRAVASDLLDELPCLRIVEEASTVELLGLADCVISDYSAVALDAGLLGCNTCFYVPDLDEYTVSPGLNIDLLDSAICFASREASAVMAAAQSASHAGFDAWRAFCSDYFAGIEYGCTERIADLICEQLG